MSVLRTWMTAMLMPSAETPQALIGVDVRADSEGMVECVQVSHIQTITYCQTAVRQFSYLSYSLYSYRGH